MRAFYGITKKSALRLKIDQKIKLIRDRKLQNYDLLDVVQRDSLIDE